jgi:hypothetical protein
VDSFPGHGIIAHAPAQAKQVHITIINPLMASVTLMEEGRANTSNFVSGKTSANATSTDHYAAFHINLYDNPTFCNEKVQSIV